MNLQEIHALARAEYAKHREAIKAVESPANTKHIADLENAYERVLDALDDAAQAERATSLGERIELLTKDLCAHIEELRSLRGRLHEIAVLVDCDRDQQPEILRAIRGLAPRAKEDATALVIHWLIKKKRHELAAPSGATEIADAIARGDHIAWKKEEDEGVVF